MSPALAPLEGKYEIVTKIKEGGMGAIYKVRHRLLDEVRVVKVLRQQLEGDADLNERFIHEARSAIRLRHPNVVQIFDFLIEEGLGYIVMEYIDGVDLAELIRRQQEPRGQGVSLPLFLEIARQGLRALGYLHQQGFVHRDISPDNLMLSSDFAGKPLIKMIDLGIAKKVEGGPNLTESGMFLGKFRYSSPEHFGSQGTGGIEPRSDLYSYGVVLVEFLTGNYPIQGSDPSQLIAGHLFHPPKDFDEIDPAGQVPKALRQILLQALDKDPEKRFASADDFTKALKPLRDQFPATEATGEEASQIRTLRPAEQPVASDSTQQRLDQAFQPTPSQAAAHDDTAHDETVPWGQVPSPESAATGSGPSPTPSSAPDEREERLFDHHLRTACALTEEGDFAQATSHFEAALKFQPDNEAVRNMLEETREKLDQERQASLERLAAEVRGLRELLDKGDWKTGRERWLSARRAYGDVDELLEVRRELDRLENQEYLHRVEERLEEASRQRESGELTQAVRSLEQAREAWRLSSLDKEEEGLSLLVQFDHEEALLEEAHRKAAALDEAVYEVESAIRNGRLVEADRTLFQALEAHGRRERLVELRKELDDLHHRELEKEVRSLTERAVQLSKKGEFADAMNALEKARIVAPAKSRAAGEIEGCRREVERAQLEWRKREMHLVGTEIETFIERQNLEQAQARLSAAEAQFGPFQVAEAAFFDALRQRIDDGFQERVNALIHEAGVALEAGRFKAAIPFLEQALELTPDDDWLADRLEQARAALDAG